MSDDFYVGYLDRAPSAVAGRVRTAVLGLAVILIAAAAAFALGQRDNGDGVYEFGVARSFEGRIESIPYPTLRVRRPAGADGADAYSRYPVVQFAKFGAAEALAPYEGQRVRLEAAVVARDGVTMLELVEGNVEALGATSEPDPDGPGPEGSDAGPRQSVVVRGEIVDSKCFLGAMKPGLGRAHKACAELCVRGGIPPLVVGTREGDQGPEFVKALLVGPDGTTLNQQVLDLIAEPVEIEGELEQLDDLMLLHTDVASIQRL